ncbi:DUF6577 family protein [Flavobacterium humidisoli]|uniref:Transcriptional regulator, AbiEi antitoxin, Type IV TA system n=1 Tax=Flavobacterium humidisoli TaxID=2937442 RepID=A0ABY4LXX0_9FLAO|nr:DUF6577 family protein [Flavobacterium humidisoli]UPZ17919.1 hypothetical protein M0M44_11355 [Flavobacterium humidisoli]
MNTELEYKLGKYFENKPTITRVELICAIKKDYPSWTQSTITVYISKLKKTGKLRSPSRGLYTLKIKKGFHPEITLKLKKLYNRVHREYPYINYCVWDTSWLNSLMRHQPFRQYLIIEVEKDAISQTFNTISEAFKNVYVNPDTNIFNYYIYNSEDVIIIKPLISEAPVEYQKKIVISSLEKLLVDMIIDKDIFAAQQGELEDIFFNALEKYTVNILKMKRYALRRNRAKEITKILNLISAK